ncbi:hypothetical protein NL528_06245 [Bradyrhizobium sp. Ash2021]|nr:hypothetical protein [Bradyrhizobium sp. Ash2021]WMT75983.1 hypothetical protein NL528_06245 [Bradyrhizobium sp. Ash2021]
MRDSNGHCVVGSPHYRAPKYWDSRIKARLKSAMKPEAAAHRTIGLIPLDRISENFVPRPIAANDTVRTNAVNLLAATFRTAGCGIVLFPITRRMNATRNHGSSAGFAVDFIS